MRTKKEKKRKGKEGDAHSVPTAAQLIRSQISLHESVSSSSSYDFLATCEVSGGGSLCLYLAIMQTLPVVSPDECTRGLIEHC